ncbi:LON peptidase substrate-binding domain-containing protein [Vibrio sp. SCSIO 43136]|uniref:LON peptidase substrate-binding domain-containing protein n=1 Tax=Vibrio sp. SCSIO 43136 TaxID=2819101 RepID=UPI0020753440|nr:LON peptidase substrate-binding domain-containing protein [Vibrio sp. SCSIO 43136]USD66600.1 LON peptidase substrate-binding domain-containing protein [Vibrio sp. SCSIO 43136]
MNEIMLFPLRSVVLPRGMMHLRIFEPRYQRMVKEACLSQSGFGICMVEETQAISSKANVSSIGTLVNIVDFESLNDGLLGITVLGEKRFSVKRVWSDSDGLRRAEVEWLPEWAFPSTTPDHGFLIEQLEEIYEQIPRIGELYTQRYFDDPSWVTQRWLELLPLECDLFEQLAGAHDCLPALRFLTETIDAG